MKRGNTRRDLTANALELLGRPLLARYLAPLIASEMRESMIVIQKLQVEVYTNNTRPVQDHAKAEYYNKDHPQNHSKNHSQNHIKNYLKNYPEDNPKDNPQDNPQDDPQNHSQDHPQDYPEDYPEDNPKNNPKNHSQNYPKDHS
ncbi:hypothetical protein GQ53DRAFT_818463 [Thozetella sp. PMI_491]|nr:hypothetical protein GQ53DRAFT_818463 [Thozetella sp. PMI_491]